LALLRHVQVDHRGLEILMAEVSLDRFELSAAREQVARARVTQLVRRQLRVEDLARPVPDDPEDGALPYFTS
jgi:hypothetical protein